MDIWSAGKLALFLIFFLPGFISMKIYDLLVPGEPRDFTKSLLEAISYSTLNFAALFWLLTGQSLPILMVSGKCAFMCRFCPMFDRTTQCCVIGITHCRWQHQHTMDSNCPEAVENPTWLLTGLIVPALAILHVSHDWSCSV